MAVVASSAVLTPDVLLLSRLPGTMTFYLSSFRVGNQAARLKTLTSGKTIGFIPNALDHVDAEARAVSNAKAMQEVLDLGIDMELVDLQSYFDNMAELEVRMATLGGVWVRGGNAFVLRQAMRLSGFDTLITQLVKADFLYGGYSAGVCVLAPRLDGLQHVDDPTMMPYPHSRVIWDGLGILDYLILPHYKSDHPESADIDIEVEYCKREGIPFRTLKDGEVIIIEDLAHGSLAEYGNRTNG